MGQGGPGGRRFTVEFNGNQRFELVSRLGSGGMGTVYEAVDRQRQGRVALKTLHSLDPHALLRLKNEFRTLQDIHHPNLVGLGELFVDKDHWFFTMELVDGCDLLEYVRPGSARLPPSRAHDSSGGNTMPGLPAQKRGDVGDALASTQRDDERLRSAFRQLAAGLQALHDSGKVHRDIKPSNVLVTRAGRVVLLDFGLATDAFGTGSSDGQVVGTAHYMAPEQAASRPLGPEADWYAVGTMLYEALTGRLPFEGRPLEVLMSKQRVEPAAPRTLDASVPRDLDALCVDLLRFDSAVRPGGREVVRRLGGEEAPPRVALASMSGSPGSAPFVGRDAELALLHQAADDARGGRAVTVLVHGDSGVGKTALVRRFAHRLTATHPEAALLSGRCYEREAVPFKAFDGVVDALSRHLFRLDPLRAALLLPHDAAALARVFPVLRRVPAMSKAQEPRREIDPQELRTRAFSALRELLLRLTEQALVVIFVDDFQWADADSLALLRDVLSPPAAPPICVVATVCAPAAEVDLPGDVRRIRLGALSPEETRELALRLLAPHDPHTEAIATAIAGEAAGHPLFLHELARHAELADGHPRALRLDDALWARVQALEPPARKLLEVAAIAGAPIALEHAAHAAGLDSAAAMRWASLLRVAHLVRGAGSSRDDAIEPYHDRVRDAVLTHLGADEQRAHHAALAAALEAGGAGANDPQALVRHLEGAGEAERAAEQAVRAARLALHALAYDQAAELFRTALRLGHFSATEACARRVELGDALANAGRGPEAAEAYLEAAPAADSATRLECRRKAAEQLLISGHLDRGLAAVHDVLADVGVAWPATPRRALLSVLWNRARLRLRGLHWTPRDESEIPARDLIRLDVYKGLTLGLSMVDSIRGTDFQLRGLLLALQTGERRRVGRALSLEAINLAAMGTRAMPRAQAVLAETSRIAEESGDPYLRAFAAAAAGTVSYFGGHFRSAQSRLVEAETLMREQTSGTSHELANLRLYRLFALRHQGACAELRRWFDEYLREAVRRSDRFMETTLARSCCLVWLAGDDVGHARRDLDRRAWSPPEGGYHLQHWYELRARTEIDLYCRAVEGSRARAEAQLEQLSRALWMRVQIVRTESWWLRGRILLASADGAGRSSAVAEVAHWITRLEREKIGYAGVWAKLLRAGAAVREGERALAIDALGVAIAEAQAAEMSLCAAAAQRRLGELLRGSQGNDLVIEADRHMTALGVLAPAKMAEVIAPGWY